MPGTGPFAYGNKGWIAFAPETTYKTPVTASKFLEIQSEGIKYSEDHEFQDTQNTRTVQHNHAGVRKVGGPFSGLMSYSGPLASLIKHAMGSVVTGTVNADGQYTHTISLAEALPTGLTFEAARDAALYGKSFQYPGCKIKKFGIKQEVAKNATFDFDIAGCGTENEITVTTPTFPTLKLMHWLHLLTGTGVITLNGAAIPANSIDFSIENPLAEDGHTLQSQVLHDLEASGSRKVMCNFNTFVEASDPAYALFKAKTSFATVITWKGPLIAGSSYYEFSISMPYCIATARDGINNGGSGRLTGPVSIQAIGNATLNNEVTITIKNADAAI